VVVVFGALHGEQGFVMKIKARIFVFEKKAPLMGNQKTCFGLDRAGFNNRGPGSQKFAASSL
jgi:hypothetical protein